MTDTKEIILNTAEKRCPKNGYLNSSVRDITGEAKVNISAINYYFGSKEKLFEAVITRKLIPTNEKRVKKFDEIIELSKLKNKKPDARKLINAFFEPIWGLMIEDENAKHFLMIIGTIFRILTPILEINLSILMMVLPSKTVFEVKTLNC